MLAQKNEQKTINDLGIQIPQVYLPKSNIDLSKWAVIACDQFTSEPEYWHEVEKFVGNSLSTLKLIFPEVYLENEDKDERVKNIQNMMKKYIEDDIFEVHEGLIYVERTIHGKTRKGIMLCLDLEQYDFRGEAKVLIHPTEGTIVDRLPPRVKIREGAMLELPHILVLIDDPNHTVIESVSSAKSELRKLYDFDLMLGSGHLAGYAVTEELENQVIESLRVLAKHENFINKYNLNEDASVLLFAMGDGNHSMAAAKEYWEQIKSQVGMNHPARYALVEIENVHDEALEFEPIHRILFNVNKDLLVELKNYFGENFVYSAVSSFEEMTRSVDSAEGQKQVVGLVRGANQFGVIEIANPTSNLAVGTIQSFLDSFMKNTGAEKIDYVHGEDVLKKIASQNEHVGFYLAGMHKSDLFKTVIVDGVLPRKAFSMGEAKEKRFYMEARKISI
ncbi:MAG: DUF1015 domain-containing protein [Anaerolineales bacterium]|nr:DUF1015 domain-containing protein [Anaerolineales bacterium]MBX3038760.1 DUF1015 domain-containing protein [Anaerolineales bacterium]